MCLPLQHRFRTCRFQERHEEPVVCFASGVQGGPRERIIVVTEGAIGILGVRPVIVSRGVSQQHGRDTKRSRVGIENIGLRFLQCKQVFSRIFVPFPPRSKQARRDKSYAGIAVIFLTHRRDEICQSFAEPWIVVVGRMNFLRRRRSRVVVEPCGDLYSLLDQKAWNAVVFSRVHHPDSEYCLMAARGDIIQQFLERLPVQCVHAGHQLSQRHITKFHAVGKLFSVVAGVWNQSLQRIVDGGLNVFEWLICHTGSDAGAPKRRDQE